MGVTPRRTVLRAAALTAASYSKILGANDRVRLGLSGAGGRGVYVMKTFQKEPGVEVAAICDVYGARIDEALTSAPGARAFTDHRQLVEMKDLDAVLIGTPDHWHAQQAIDAMNAGKDVYVEKPLTLRREEGPQIVRAARVNHRICQVGMQQRSGRIYLEAQERFIRTGRLGKITTAKLVWHGGPVRAFRSPVAAKPSNLDWDRFLGQVKWREWNPFMYFNYRAFLPDFGGGKITDLFTHLGGRGAHVPGGRWSRRRHRRGGHLSRHAGRPDGARHDSPDGAIPQGLHGHFRIDRAAQHARLPH